ncbi:MAG: protein kinase, partial [Planctomycetes bacterium]|nr:protein kinase [Planctomycetota bacterium]
AIKVLPGELARDEMYVGRFEREAKLAAQISHPNAVQIYDVGEEGGRHFIVMEYVEGVSVSELLEEGPLEQKEALRITRDVAKALARAHEKGIIHRDIKPANILVSSEGTVKVADLGLAKRVGGSDSMLSLTKTGTSPGTPGYMSPEQCQGSKNIDNRTDIYSLGVTLFHMVCGEQPFTGDTPMNVLYQHVNEPLPDPQKINPAVGNATADLIRSMTAKDPDARMPNCKKTVARIEAILSGKPLQNTARAGTSTAPPSQTAGKTAPAKADPERPTGISKKSKLLVATVAIFAAALIVFAVIAYLYTSRGRPSGGTGQREEYAALVRDAEDAEKSGDMARALELYRRARPLADDPETTRRAIARILSDLPEEDLGPRYRKKRAEAMRLASERDWERAARAYTEALEIADQMQKRPSDYRDLLGRLAYVRENLKEEKPREDRLKQFRKEIRDGEDAMAKGELDEAARIFKYALTLADEMDPPPPDRHEVEQKLEKCRRQLDRTTSVAGRNFRLKLLRSWRLETSHDRVYDYHLKTAASAVALHSGSGILAAATPDGTIHFFSLDRGQIAAEKEHMDLVLTLAFSPDGQLLASCGKDGKVKLWDARNARVVETLTREPQPVADLAFRPESKWLAIAGSRGTVKLLNLGARNRPRLLHGHEGTVRSLAFSHDGRIIVTGGEDGKVKFRDVSSGNILSEHECNSPVVCIALEHSSKTVAFSTKTGKLWARSRGAKNYRLIDDEDRPARWISLSPDGKYLAAAGNDGGLKIWDPSTADLVRDLPDHDGPIAFSQKGTYLVDVRDTELCLWTYGTDPDQGPLPEITLFGETPQDTQSPEDMPHGCRRIIRTGLPGGGSVALKFSNDSVHLFHADFKKSVVQKWNIDTGDKVFEIGPFPKPLQGFDINPRNDRFATLTSNPKARNTTIRLRDGDSGKSLREWSFQSKGKSLCYENRGEALLFGRDGALGWLNIRESRPKPVGKGRFDGRTLAVSPDGRLAAGTEGDRIAIWDLENSRLKEYMKHHRNDVTSLSFHPEGSRLASGSLDGSVKIWDPRKGALISTPVSYEHDEPVYVAFSPDRHLLASAGVRSDRGSVVELRDIKRMDRLADWEPGHNVAAFAFTPDGRLLATAGETSGTIKVWNLKELLPPPPRDKPDPWRNNPERRPNVPKKKEW